MRSLHSDSTHKVHGNHRTSTSRIATFDAPSFAPAVPREATDARLMDAYTRAEAAGRAAGESAGFAAGMAAGRSEVDAMIARHDAAASAAEAAATALQAAAEQLQLADQLVLRDVERMMTTMAMELAAAIVGHEVLLPGAALDAVRAAARLAPERQAVSIRLHPADVHDVNAQLAGLHLPAGSTVVPDPMVGRGQTVVDAGNCRIDHQVSGALARMRAAIDEFYGLNGLDADPANLTTRTTEVVAA